MADPSEQLPLSLGKIMTGGASKQDRVEHDFYPTPPEATHALVDFLEEKDLATPGVERVWEPAAGDGHLAEVLRDRGYETAVTDIRPTDYVGKEYGQRDFLEITEWMPGADYLITNPPFNLALQFITHALSFRPPLVAMLLKCTYWHTQTRSQWFHQKHIETGDLIRPDWVLPIGWRLAFQPERGSAPVMDCSWFVWTLHDRRETCGYHPLPPLTNQEALL